MTSWCIWQTPLYNKPPSRADALAGRTANGVRLMDLPAYSIVEVSDRQDTWSFVTWTSNQNKTFVGWVNANLLDDYQREFPAGLVKTANPTPNPNDAPQYIVYQGRAQFNLCGEFCICFAAGWQYSIEDWLDEWKSKPSSWFNRVFNGGLSRGTGIKDLDNMLSSFDGYTLPSLTLDKALTRTAPKTPMYTPGRVAEILRENYIIAGCKIDAVNGRLRGQGVAHWVVLDKCTPDRVNNGWVELYNPYPDSMERYSWKEFIASAGQPFGIVVKR